MKYFNAKLLMLLVTAASLMIVSCGDDDSDDGLSTANLVGTWKLTILETTGCTDASWNETSTANADNQMCEDEDGVMFCSEFTAVITATAFNLTTEEYEDGVASYNETDVQTYTLNGDQLTLCDNSNDCETLTASLSGNTLTMTSVADASNGCTDVIVLTKQ